MIDEAAGAVLSPLEVDPAPEAVDTPEGRENGSERVTGARKALEGYFARLAGARMLTAEAATELGRGVLDAIEPYVDPATATLPVDSYRDAAPYLRRPFAPNAVRFKLQTEFGAQRDDKGRLRRDGDNNVIQPPKGALVVAYIDARTVIDRLNMVCPHLWSDEYEREADKLLRCHLTVDGITRTDVGEGVGKAAYSDALKRAGVKFGIGVSLYSIPTVRLWVGDGAAKLQLRGDRLVLSDANVEALRKGYAKWLEREGSKHFGEPLDHGDAPDATGDPLDPDNPESEPVPEGVDPETGEVKDPGPKIRKARLEALTELVDTAPPWWTPDDAHQWLDEHRVKLGETDLLTRMKDLRAGQADEFEAWLKGLPVEEPKVPVIE